jgi:hypothetical protein
VIFVFYREMKDDIGGGVDFSPIAVCHRMPIMYGYYITYPCSIEGNLDHRVGTQNFVSVYSKLFKNNTSANA